MCISITLSFLSFTVDFRNFFFPEGREREREGGSRALYLLNKKWGKWIDISRENQNSENMCWEIYLERKKEKGIKLIRKGGWKVRTKYTCK